MATSPPSSGLGAGFSPTPRLGLFSFGKQTLPGPLGDIQTACADLANMNEVNTLAIAALLQRIMLGYYADIRDQARWSLTIAIGAALLGAILFMTGFVNTSGINGGADIQYRVVAGSLVMIIAALCFFSYTRVSRRLAAFYVGLERTNRFILADALCQRLDQSERNRARKRLVGVIAQASMLTVDGAAQRDPEVPLERVPGQPPPLPTE